MKLATITNQLCTSKLIEVRTSPEHLLTRTIIHTTARVAQVSFAFGCLTAGLDIAYSLLQVLTGGSIVLQGVKIMVQVVHIGIYHDLAKLSSNIASLFKSQVLIQYAKDSVGSRVYGKTAIQIIEDCERGFTLPDSEMKNLSNARGITKAATHGTLAVYNFNPQIEQFLDRKI